MPSGKVVRRRFVVFLTETGKCARELIQQDVCAGRRRQSHASAGDAGRSSTSNISATAGSGYNALAGTLNWASGDAAAKPISRRHINDALLESNETFQITWKAPNPNERIEQIEEDNIRGREIELEPDL